MGDKTDYFKDLNIDVNGNSNDMSDGISQFEDGSDPQISNRYISRKTSSLQSIIDALKYTSGLKRTDMVAIMKKSNKPKQDMIVIEQPNSLKGEGDADINKRQWRRLSKNNRK